MDYNKQKVDDMILALLHLTTFTDKSVSRAWKSHDWDALSRLHDAGLIGDPRNKNKSVVFTAEGLERSAHLFRKYFGEAV